MEQMEDLDDKAKAFVDRLLLRLMTSPALMSFLEDVQTIKKGNDFEVELLFRKVPDEQINAIKQAIAEKTTAFTFEKKGQDYFAFKVSLKAADLQPPDLDSTDGHPD